MCYPCACVCVRSPSGRHEPPWQTVSTSWRTGQKHSFTREAPDCSENTSSMCFACFRVTVFLMHFAWESSKWSKKGSHRKSCTFHFHFNTFSSFFPLIQPFSKRITHPRHPKKDTKDAKELCAKHGRHAIFVFPPLKLVI